MAGRCAALCQHPGCWHSGEKHETKGRECPGYSQYIDYAIAKRKTRTPNSTTATRDDGLPYLTVTDISNDFHPLPTQTVYSQPPLQESAFQHSPPSQLLTDKFRLHSAEKKLSSSTCSMRFSIDSPLCIDRVRSPSPVYDEYWFTPVLIWQPNKKKKERKEDDPNEEEKKNQSVLKTTNLTDTLPDLHVHHCKQQQPKEKRSINKAGRRRSKGFKLSMDQYIIEGLSDVPPHIVNQIIQELHSQSSADAVPVQEPLTKESSDCNPVLHRYPSSPPPSSSVSHPFKLHPQDSAVPSSLMFNLHSEKINNSKEKQKSLKRQSKWSKGGTMSYSRVLASQPQKALSGLKIRVAKLQEEDDHYYTFSKSQNVNNTWDDIRPNQDPLTKGSKFPGANKLPPTSIQSGPSHFAPRSLNKATIQRLNCHVTVPNKIFPSGTLDLSVSSARSKLRKSKSQIPVPPHPSIHIPLLPIQDKRPFSEELSTAPPGSCPEPYTRPESSTRPESQSALRSGTASSHMSSDHLIISADLTRQTGELLLLNRAGEIVHHVKETEAVNGNGASDDDDDDDSMLENGLVAPPPTARNELSLECLVNDSESNT